MKPKNHSFNGADSIRQNPDLALPDIREPQDWRRLRRKTRQVLHEALIDQAWERDLLSDLDLEAVPKS